MLYSILVRLRNFLYDRKILEAKKLPVPVVCVGNLSVGGSGKTSLVRYLARELSTDYRVAIVMRGYKRRSRGLRVVSDRGRVLLDVSEAGDEAYMLSKFLSPVGVSVVVAENRYEGGLKACEELDAQLVLLDDGFQHRSLHRDLDILLLKKRDIGDRVLPFGRLREPLSSLRRASCVVLSYQDTEPFGFSFGDKPVFKMYRRFNSLLRYDFERVGLEELKGKEVVAFAGLGDNTQFFKSLDRLGVRVAKTLSFGDHHDYRDFQLEENRIYLTTPKDMVKLKPAENLLALDFELEVQGLLEFVKEKLKARL